ncbi:MAG: hypothetical protein AAFV33_05960 [Chloroflexota bacterium]
MISLNLKTFSVVLLLIAAVFVLAACASDAPEGAVTGYFEALVSGDETTARNLSCAEWESVAQTRITQFASLDARLEGASCSAAGTLDDGGTRVTCEGDIVITYGTEDQSLPLGNYKVVQEGGSWRMCGETE